MDDNDDDGFVPQERPQRRVPVSQDNEDLVVKGNTSNILHLQQCTDSIDNGCSHVWLNRLLVEYGLFFIL